MGKCVSQICYHDANGEREVIMRYPKIGIRPVIDGRWGGVRESLCEFPYKSRVMGTSEPLKPLKAPYMARNPVKWGFFRLKGQEIPLKI